LPDTILVSCENFQLPPVDVPVAQAAPDVRRTQRSRRKLARLALAVRKRLRIAEATIARQERRLKEHDECVHQLEELENDLAARREMLEASQAAWEENRARAEEALMRRTMVPTDESGRPLTDDDAARSLKIRAQELAHLARHLQNREQQVSAAEARCHEQRAEIETLRLQLLNREAELATKPIAPAPSEPNWEDELVQLRGELERDRAQLNSQIERLKERQEDLEAASKEAELEMSRERAQIGRDRAELMRLRDDIRFEQQKSTRNGDAHDRLETIRRLKDELARSSDHGETTRPNTDQGSHPNANRWRNLRGLNGESLG
jgi:DNA repair exonuclease SbcCD ATPase subunit